MTLSTMLRQAYAYRLHLAVARCAAPLVAGLVGALTLMGAPAAQAGCLPAGGGSFVCTGANTGPQIILNDDATVTTAPGFGVDLALPGEAFVIEGNGTLSYADTHQSALNGSDMGLGVHNLGGGAGVISIVSNGAISSDSFAVTAANEGLGATTVALSGPVTGGLIGVLATNNNASSTGALTVSTGAVTGGVIGIYAQNYGLGATAVSSTGTVTGTAVAGVSAAVLNAANTGGLVVDLVNATGEVFGVVAQNDGLGVTQFTSTGTITGRTGLGLQVLGINTANTNDVLVDVQSVTGDVFGMVVLNDGVGTTTRINVGGTVQGQVGIHTESFSDTAVAITNNGVIRSTDGAAGLAIDTAFSGAVTLVNNGRLIGNVALDDFDDVLTNAGVWTVRGDSFFGAGNDRIVNLAGATIQAASDASVAETTYWDSLESYSGGGTLSLVDGGGFDLLEIDGNLNFGAGAAQAIDLGAKQDAISVSGTANIADASLHVALLPDYVLGQTFEVLLTGGGRIGEYKVVTGGTAYLRLDDTYDANNAYITVVQGKTLAALGRTPNQIATASGLESLPLSNVMVQALLLTPTDATARAMMDNLSGEVHASTQSMLLQDSRLVRNAILAHLRSSFGDTAATAPVLGYAEGTDVLDWQQPELTQIWSQALGNWGQLANDSNAAEMQTTTGGLLAGADSMVGDWRIGLMAGYGRSGMAIPDRASTGNSNNYNVALYGGTEWGDVAFRTGLAYSWNDISTRRTIGTLGEVLTANYADQVAQAFGELAYTTDLNGVAFEPFANVAVVGVQSDGFTEQGGNAALSVEADGSFAAFTTLGLRASTKFIIGETTLVTAKGGIGWRQGFGSAPTVRSNFAGSDGFTIAGAAFDGGALVVDAGVDFAVSERARFGVSYDGVIGSAQFDQKVDASFSVRF